MNATEPQKADTFFKNLSPSMASFYNEAKKLSKKYEHFFIGQEHFLAAFFLNNNSVIRKYPRNPKWNAKKKIETLLKSSYAAQKNGCNWFKQNGFLVNPRMQDSWSEAVGRTKFKDSAEVHEIHVLYGIFERPNKPIVDWLEQEGLYNEAAIKSFLEEEMKNQDKLVYEKGDVEEKPEKPKANPLGFLAKLFSGGKDKPIEAESAFTAEDDEEDEARNASILYTDEYDFKHDKNSIVPHVPDPEPEYAPQSAPSDADVEPYIPQAPKPSKKKSRSLNIGNQFVYMEDELINRGMPQGIFDRFADLNDKLGSLPDKVPFNGKKIYFDDLLNKNLSESEYEDVVNAMSSSADAAASRSPFRSTVDSSASQHSLFKSKASDKAEGSDASGVYEINSSDSAPENSDEVPSFSDSSKDEVPSFSDSSKDEVPSFSDSS
ncbi:MAG: Clp protease N-terminal domain-containing protein, partial [bacterium]|nr:Clp protease N-terminal domain-containing protein [bacterium]